MICHFEALLIESRLQLSPAAAVLDRLCISAVTYSFAYPGHVSVLDYWPATILRYIALEAFFRLTKSFLPSRIA